ncbi:MAG: methionine synthase [Ignavibacteriales bacterium]|nr:methionine synthase [Ignavibacteriales bacterium]
MPISFLDILKEKIVVFDGATGTHLQSQNLTADDFGGEHYNGCNEYLVVTRPSAVENVHRDYLEAGCDVIETNSFGGASTVLAEYGLGDSSYDLNFKAASLARNVAHGYSRKGHPRFVAGSMGPTTKLPSLGHISFKEMADSYQVQARALIDGGVDLLSLETCQDVLQIKSALCGIHDAFQASGKRVPIVVSVTIETMGTMLLGTEIAAALAAIEPFDVDVIGMNCATGPKEMSDHVRVLSASSPKPIFVMPNAGLPENIGGKAHYHLSPPELSKYLSHFVKDLGVQVVGGCCGTTQEHIRQLVQAVGNLSPAPRKFDFVPGASSLYQAIPFQTLPPPILIGERTNANGSKQFRELLLKEDWEAMVAMGRDQVREQAHMLDVCVAYAGRNEAADMRELITRFNTQISIPLVLDSTEPPVIEEALQRIGGKAIVNSINLEDGEERLAKVVGLCKRYGAAVIALTIDENGMTKTAQSKLAVARRIYELAVGKYGMKPHDLIFDLLTFTLGSGEEEFRRSGLETLEGIRLVKQEFPGVHTSLGVSNVSFGLSPALRHALNSVFLHFAVEAGLDMAIVHASKIMPLFKIDERGRELCRHLIFDERKYEGEGADRRCVYDPLTELMAYYAGQKTGEKARTEPRGGTIEERLKNRIIDGNKVGIPVDLEEALKRIPALDIINVVLLDGMKVVGELFGSGQMQLPFVLQSAEVMKSAVSFLEPFLDKKEGSQKGTLVIATVKGDVHDIGKNLVDIILTNNGYRVINLGIRCPIETMLQAVHEHNADAIGMSGLLVKSTLIMKENLEVMNERNLKIPVILGGAALTKRYVDGDLRPLYKGDVYYANDAFDGLRYMEDILSGRAETPSQEKKIAADPESLTGSEAKIALALEVESAESAHGVGGNTAPAARSKVRSDVSIPQPPFWGSRIVKDVSLDEVFKYVNETALIRGQWRFVRGTMGDEEYQRLMNDQVLPEYQSLREQVKREQLLVPQVVYGYFPCQSDGNELIIYHVPSEEAEESESEMRNPKSEPSNPQFSEWLRFSFPRQTDDRHLCIADYFASVGSGKMDVLACHVVTVGQRASEYAKKLYDANSYKDYLYFHGLSVESAEALAELWHKRMREDLGIAGNDAPHIKRLFSQGYQGSRFSFGYPACPRLEDQTKLFELLKPERIGVFLTEEYQMEPEQSTSALVVHHPEARYFTVK